MRHALISLALLLPTPLALAQQPAPQDHRQLATMPELPRALMRADMQDHLVALNEIFGYLAENKLDAAAETAEKRLGKSAMGKHAAMARGQGPGASCRMQCVRWGGTCTLRAANSPRWRKEAIRPRPTRHCKKS